MVFIKQANFFFCNFFFLAVVYWYCVYNYIIYIYCRNIIWHYYFLFDWLCKTNSCATVFAFSHFICVNNQFNDSHDWRQLYPAIDQLFWHISAQTISSQFLMISHACQPQWIIALKCFNCLIKVIQPCQPLVNLPHTFNGFMLNSWPLGGRLCTPVREAASAAPADSCHMGRANYWPGGIHKCLNRTVTAVESHKWAGWENTFL